MNQAERVVKMYPPQRTFTLPVEQAEIIAELAPDYKVEFTLITKEGELHKVGDDLRLQVPKGMQAISLDYSNDGQPELFWHSVNLVSRERRLQAEKRALDYAGGFILGTILGTVSSAVAVVEEMGPNNRPAAIIAGAVGLVSWIAAFRNRHRSSKEGDKAIALYSEERFLPDTDSAAVSDEEIVSPPTL